MNQLVDAVVTLVVHALLLAFFVPPVARCVRWWKRRPRPVHRGAAIHADPWVQEDGHSKQSQIALDPTAIARAFAKGRPDARA